MAKLNVKVAQQLKHALIVFGVKEPQLGYLMAQAAYETSGFEKLPALSGNNLAGIKYNRHLKNIANASSNFSAPPSEGPNGHYAHFAGIDDFIKGWILYAHLKNKRPGNNIGAPWDASNLLDYGHRLKLNGYYQDPESKYQNGLKAWYARLQKLPEESMWLRNTVASLDLVKYSKNVIPYHIGIDTSSNGISVLKQKNSVPNFNSAPLATHSFINTAKQIWEGGANLKILQKWNTPVNTFSNPMDNLPANNNAKPQPAKTNTGQRINIIQNENPYKSIFAIPNLINDTLSFALPPPLSEAGSLAARARSVGTPGDMGAPASFAPFYKTYRVPPLPGNDALSHYTEGNGHNAMEMPFAQGTTISGQKPGNHPANENTIIPATGRSPVSINLNKPLIENFTINVKDPKDGTNGFKQMVEEVLLEILNGANAI